MTVPTPASACSTTRTAVRWFCEFRRIYLQHGDEAGHLLFISTQLSCGLTPTGACAGAAQRMDTHFPPGAREGSPRVWSGQGSRPQRVPKALGPQLRPWLLCGEAGQQPGRRPPGPPPAPLPTSIALQPQLDASPRGQRDSSENQLWKGPPATRGLRSRAACDSPVPGSVHAAPRLQTDVTLDALAREVLLFPLRLLS